MKAPPSVVNPRHPTEKIALHDGGKKKILKRCKNNTICEPDYRQQTLQPPNNAADFTFSFRYSELLFSSNHRRVELSCSVSRLQF
jgi:hypothetical protein